MKRTTLFLLSAVAAYGCQKDDTRLRKELEDLKKGQEKLLQSNEKLAAAIASMPRGGGPAGAAPQRPQRPRPNPESVYSVNIAGSPFKGAKDAKVTIVEAFEFA